MSQNRHRAKRLRQNMTEAEQKLWQALRARQLGRKFRRQHPLGPYIVDFVCLQDKLVIEVDGGQHLLQVRSDQARTHWLQKSGYRVLRFWNNNVLKDINTVMERIDAELTSSPPQPSPLKGEGVLADS